MCFPVGANGKGSACNARDAGRRGFDPWVRKIPWKRAWQPTPVFLPKKFHGQRSLEGYSPWICKESDMTEQLCTRIYILHTSLHIYSTSYYFKYALYMCAKLLQ